MSDPKSQWPAFAEAWQAFDKAFAEIDRMPATPAGEFQGKPVHRITATTWGKRWRFFCLFQKLAWKLLFRGRVTVKL